MAGPGTKNHPQYREGREALLEAASHIIARKGFRGLTYRAVAEEAGVTHGLVSYHFGSRERLIHETIAHVSAAAVEGSRIATPTGKLEDFAQGLSTLVATTPDGQAMQFELALEARRRPELLDEIRQLYAGYFELVSGTLERLGIADDPALTRLVFAALDGLTIQQLIFERKGETDEAVGLLRRLLAPLVPDRDARVAESPDA